MTEKQVLKTVLASFDGETPEALQEVWTASKIDFDEFLERPDEFGIDSTGAVGGLIDYDDMKSLGKKWLHVALVEANRLDYELKNFLYEGSEDEVDFNFVCWFLYELLIIQMIDYVETAKEEEEEEEDFNF